MLRTLRVVLTAWLAAALPGAARAAGAFESLHCFRYAVAKGTPVEMLLFGTDRGKTFDAPFALCVAKRGSEAVVLDAGFVDPKLGAEYKVTDYRAFRPLFAEIGVRPEDVSLVTISHLHWDHAGGTGEFPNARFVVQRRELEFAAGAMTQNKHARGAVRAEDVLALVKLNWEGRVLLPDGDVEDLVPGLDVYLTPGHTIGTMTVCLDTAKSRVCYASDAVYTWRNLEEDIALGLALDQYQSVESFAKIRRLVGGGILIPGHEARIFDDPGARSFREVADGVVAIVE